MHEDLSFDLKCNALCVMSILVYDEDAEGSSEFLGTIMQPEKVFYKIKD